MFEGGEGRVLAVVITYEERGPCIHSAVRRVTETVSTCEYRCLYHSGVMYESGQS